MPSPPACVRLRETDPSESTLVLEGPFRVKRPITVSLCSCRLGPLTPSGARTTGVPSPGVPLLHVPACLKSAVGLWRSRRPLAGTTSLAETAGVPGVLVDDPAVALGDPPPPPALLPGVPGMPVGVPASEPASGCAVAPASEDEARKSPAMALRVEGLRAAVVSAGLAVAGREPWLSLGTPAVVGVLVMALMTLEVVSGEGSASAAAEVPPMPLVAGSAEEEVGVPEAAPMAATTWSTID